MTSIPFLTYIALFFISVIEFSTKARISNLVATSLGIIIFISGIYLRYQALIAFHDSKQKWRSDIDTENIHAVVRTGPYKFVRHPYYLSVMLELLGIALTLNAFKVIVLILLIQASLLWKRILEEESELIKKFGDEYLSYKKQVPIFFSLRSIKK